MTRKEKETILSDLFNNKKGAEKRLLESKPKALVFDNEGVLEIEYSPDKNSSTKPVGALYEAMGALKFKSFDKRLDLFEGSGGELPLFT